MWKKKWISIWFFLLLTIGIGSFNVFFSSLKISSAEREEQGKKGLGMIVNEEGDICWTSESRKATNDIVWRPQGFHILLKESEKYGYPFGKDNKANEEFVRIDMKGGGVSVEKTGNDSNLNEKATFLYTIKWKTLKQKIEEKVSFFEKIMDGLSEDGSYTVYVNGIFEVLQKKEKIQLSSKNLGEDGYYYLGDSKVKYDIIHGKTFQVLKQDLKNVDEIESAAYWVDKTEWRNKDNKHYNFPVKIRLEENFAVKLVEQDGEVIGRDIQEKGLHEKIKQFLDKNPLLRATNKNPDFMTIDEFQRVCYVIPQKTAEEHFNPRAAFQVRGYPEFSMGNFVKKKGKNVEIALPKKISIPDKDVVFRLIGCYSYNNEGRKVYKTIINKDTSEKDGFLTFVHQIHDRQTVYGEYVEDEEITIIVPKEDVLEGSGRGKPIGEIGAGTIEKSEFQIDEGIPVSESYYKRVVSENYILNYRFIKKTGKKTYSVRSKVTWKLTEEKPKDKGKGKKKTPKKPEEDFTHFEKMYSTYVTRSFSYWIIDKLEYFALDEAVIKNRALPDSGVAFNVKKRDLPLLVFTHSEKETDHILHPKEIEEVIDLGIMNGGGTTVPYFDPSLTIEKKVGEIRVKNDSLSFDGRTYMEDGMSFGVTQKPLKLPVIGEKIGEKSLYSHGKKIDKEVENGIYKSSGKVVYRLIQSLGSDVKKKLEYKIKNLNSIKVHTPVVCDFLIRDAKKWCQLIKPKKNRHQLVLTKDFELEILTKGSHKKSRGYGKKDYKKYTESREVIFPFDVIKDGKIIKAGRPIRVNRKEKFEIPIHVKEGEYEVKLYAFAINAKGREKKKEKKANIKLENHVATNDFKVEISGRLMDFTLEKIKNSSLWDKVFENMKEPKGFRLDKLPLIKGDHPYYENMGDFKKGYAVEIAVTTIGNYLNEAYGVELDLSFFVYDSLFNHRKKVDVYYEAVSEKTGQSLGLVRIGSKRDKENLHFLKGGKEPIPIFTYKKIRMPRELLHPKSNENLQRWLGEFSLPARLYICEKGHPISNEVRKRTGLLYDEDFWIKKGKLVILAKISTLKDNKKVLSYINEKNEKDGYMNRWKYETGKRKKIMFGKPVTFKDGEVFVYDIEKSIWLERGVRVKKGW